MPRSEPSLQRAWQTPTASFSWAHFHGKCLVKAAPCSARDQPHVQQGDDFKSAVEAIPSAIIWFVFFQWCGNNVVQEEHGETSGNSFLPRFCCFRYHQECGKIGNTLTWNRNVAFCQLWNQVQRGELVLMLWLMINLFTIKTHADFHALLFTALVSGCL